MALRLTTSTAAATAARFPVPSAAPAAAVLALGALLTAPLATSSLGAQEAGFQGTYVHDAAAGDPMNEVVDEGVSLVRSWLKRQFARGRIRETNVPYEWIRIETDDEGARVVTDQWELVVPYEGGIEGWERAEGDFIDVTVERFGAGALLQRFQGEDGARTNVYRLSDDGRTLTMEVTITSDQLSGPLRYEQVYRRR